MMKLNISITEPITFEEFVERFDHMVKISYTPKREAVLRENYERIRDENNWPKNASTKRTRKRKK